MASKTEEGVARPTIRLRFLGTGASGGTPGVGRSSRLESSLGVSDGDAAVLFDATRDLRDQLAEVDARMDAVVLTQIGRSAPPHDELTGIVAALCPRAAPAYDGLVLTV